MLPTAADLSYFLVVADTLNVRRAAERLRLAQPSLSMSIRRLEDAIGSPLFIREKSGVRLTRTGQRLVPKARALLEEWEKIRSEAARDEVEVSGRYLVGCPSDLAQLIVPFFVPKLMQVHSALEIELVYGTSRRIGEDVVSFKVDFGIVASPVRHPDLVIKRICSDEIRMWVSATESYRTQDLGSGEAVLVYDPAIFGSLRPIGPDGGATFKRTIKTTNFHVVASMVGAGVGIGVLPGRLASISGLKLRPLSREVLNIPHEICLIYRSDAQRSNASRQFAHELEAALLEAMESGRSL